MQSMQRQNTVEEVKKIGLVETEKVAADVTKWQFNGASLKLEGKIK